MEPASIEFSKFFFKIRSYDTIYTFKNYFATVFLTINFQFSAISGIQIDSSSILIPHSTILTTSKVFLFYFFTKSLKYSFLFFFILHLRLFSPKQKQPTNPPLMATASHHNHTTTATHKLQPPIQLGHRSTELATATTHCTSQKNLSPPTTQTKTHTRHKLKPTHGTNRNTSHYTRHKLKHKPQHTTQTETHPSHKLKPKSTNNQTQQERVRFSAIANEI